MKTLNKLITTLMIIAGILSVHNSFAHGEGGDKLAMSKPIPQLPFTLDFIENKGQWKEDFQFKTEINNATIFITSDGFVYKYANESDIEHFNHEMHKENLSDEEYANLSIRYHAYRVRFEGSNKSTAFHKEEKRSYYHNYFIGNDESTWAGHVGLFGKVTQKNVYNGIDLSVYSSKDKSFKYDFIVHKGANPNQIKLSYEGVVPQINNDGNLFIKTSVNEILELAPYSYQIIDGREVVVESKYALSADGKLSFVFPNGYNTNYELIIDPELIFATYSGATGSGSGPYAHASGYDFDGAMFAGARIWDNSSGWPVTLGAFQTTIAANISGVGINKYTPDGLGLIYSTFFAGGPGSATLPYALRVNSGNELFLAGLTNSPNVPVTSGAFQTTFNGGGSDIYLAHFTYDGSALLGSTYIGTNQSEGAITNLGSITTVGVATNYANTISSVEINFSNNNNVWLVSNTSGTNFPLTSNAMQLTYGGGLCDGVIVSLNPTLTNLLYSSYIGGSGADAALSLDFTSTGMIAVAGSTTSTDFPTTTGVLNATAPGGSQDGFVTLFNPTVGNVIASTYIGTNANDHVTQVEVFEDNIYLLGRNQTSNYPVHPIGVYSKTSGSSFMFFEKLSTDLTTSIQSTIIGGGTMFTSAFMVDICGNVYAGVVGAGAGMPLTNDAFQTQTDDFYFLCLGAQFTELLFGSYFGDPNAGDHAHIGVNRLDPSGNIYHSMCANSSAWPTFPTNVFSPNKQNTGGQDIVSYKFNFDKAGVNAEFKLDPNTNSKDSGCVPFTVNFANNSTQVVDYFWDFGDGGTSTLQSPTHTYMSPGTYTIELMTVNDTACVTHDTAYYTVYVFQLDTPKLVTRDTVLCNPENSLDISVEILNPSSNILGNTIKWTSTPPGGIIGADSTDTITVNPSIATTYTVTVWDSIPHLCSTFGTAQVNIDLSPRELEIYTNDTTVCYGDTIQVSAKGTAGYTYKWSPTTGVLDTTALEPKIVVTQPTVYILTSSYPFCLDTSVMFQVDVEYYPVVTIDAPKEACRYTEVILNSNISPFRNDYTYTWTPNINLSNNNLPNTILTADTTVNYKLTVSTPAGCTGSDEVSIAVHPGNFGDAISDMGYCPPGELELWATGGVKYRWSPSIGLSNDTIYNPKTNVSTTTEYQVIITDANNCEDTFNVIVTVYPLAVLSLPDSVVIHKGESYRVEPATNCLYFNWFPPSGVSDPQTSDPELSPLVRTKYYVTASTENGCETTDSMIVMVDGSKFDVPNAFAPGKGNVFKPIKRGDATLNSFTVYNRWGNKIFETKNIDEGWDGTFNGTEQSAGVYVYIVDAVAKDGEQIKMQGNVTLVR